MATVCLAPACGEQKLQNMALACHQSVAGLTDDFYLALAALA